MEIEAPPSSKGVFAYKGLEMRRSETALNFARGTNHDLTDFSGRERRTVHINDPDLDSPDRITGRARLSFAIEMIEGRDRTGF